MGEERANEIREVRGVQLESAFVSNRRASILYQGAQIKNSPFNFQLREYLRPVDCQAI
jgi:hypothetical protein